MPLQAVSRCPRRIAQRSQPALLRDPPPGFSTSPARHRPPATSSPTLPNHTSALGAARRRTSRWQPGRSNARDGGTTRGISARAQEVLEPTLAVAEGYEFASGSRPPTGSKRRQSRDGVEADHSPASTIAFHARSTSPNHHSAPAICSGTAGTRLHPHLHRDGCRNGCSASRRSAPAHRRTRTTCRYRRGSRPTPTRALSGPVAPTAFPHSAHTYADTFVKPGNVFTLPQCGHVAVAHSSPSRPLRISTWITPTTAPHSLQRSSTLVPSTAAMMQPQHSTPAVSWGTMGIRLVRSWLRSASMLHTYHRLQRAPHPLAHPRWRLRRGSQDWEEFVCQIPVCGFR